MALPEQSIGVGMLGYAFMGKAHSIGYRNVSAIAPSGVPWPRLVSVFGRTEDRLREAQIRYGWGKAVLDWHDIVEDPEIQLVDNAGPNHLHAEPTIAAAKSGKHVICEKPLGPTAEVALRMWREAEKANVHHMCAFNYRFIPALQLARRLIITGSIGALYHYRSNFLLSSALERNRRHTWRDEEIGGGGALGDLGSHHIDLSRFLTGSEPKTVQALSRVVIPKCETGQLVETDDLFAAILEYENGCVGVLEASRVAGGHLVTSRIEIDGSNGSIQFSLQNLNQLLVAGADQVFKLIPVLRSDDPYSGYWFPPGHPLGWSDSFGHQAVHLMGAIGGLHAIGPIGATFRDGYYCAEIVAAIQQAARTKAAVDISYQELFAI